MSRVQALLICLLGVIIITPDSLLIRLTNQDSLVFVFWRNLFSALMLFCLYGLSIAYRHYKHASQPLKAYFIKDSKDIWKLWLTLPVGSILFVLGTNHNSVASNLSIIAASPIFGLILTIFFMKGRAKLDSMLAIFVVISGVIIVVGGDILDGHLFGAIFGIITAISLALHFAILNKNTHINVMLGVGVGTFITAVILLPFVQDAVLSPSDWVYVIINGLFISGLSFLLTSYGAKKIAPEEVCLIFLLETLLGPIWVWLGISERPSETTLLGGSIIVLVVFIWFMRQLLKKSNYSNPVR